MPGNNFVELRAADGGGRVTTKKVTVNWQGLGGGATPSATGPVLVLAAHPDDESLGMAGIIERARSQGRRVVVALATNGEGGRPRRGRRLRRSGRRRPRGPLRPHARHRGA